MYIDFNIDIDIGILSKTGPAEGIRWRENMTEVFQMVTVTLPMLSQLLLQKSY